MKPYWTALLAIPVLATVAMAPLALQDPKKEDPVTTKIRLAELHYVDQGGTTTVVPAGNLLELRLLSNGPGPLRIELFYENGDYSLIEPQAFHLIRKGQGVQDVRLLRVSTEQMLFPVIP